MNRYEYDLFVIGGGSGGVRAARWGANKGLKVGLAEGARLGGTCVNVGCVPKKLFFHAAHLSSSFEQAKGFGWELSPNIRHDWHSLKAGIDAYLIRLNGIYARLLDQAGVTRYPAWASLKSEHEIELIQGDQQQVVTAKYILLAPGAAPDLPPFEGYDHCSTSDDFFALTRRPQSALVVGSGYIGVELASVFAGLGVDTTLVYRSDLPLKGFEPELRVRLDQALRHHIKVSSETHIDRVVGGDHGLKKVFVQGSEVPIEAEFILLATGRKPNTSQLNLESIGIALSETRQAIIVDEQYRTNIKHIFAVGDAIDRMHLTPVALAEGMRVIHQIIDDPLPPLDYELVPTTVFSHPNIATVGLGEEEAKTKGYCIKVFESDFKPLQQALQPEPQRVYMKLIVDHKSDRVLGCHMIGEEAGEQIQGLAVALQAGVTKHQLDQTIGIHPTMAEEWVTMRSSRS